DGGASAGRPSRQPDGGASPRRPSRYVARLSVMTAGSSGGRRPKRPPASDLVGVVNGANEFGRTVTSLRRPAPDLGPAAGAPFSPRRDALRLTSPYNRSQDRDFRGQDRAMARGSDIGQPARPAQGGRAGGHRLGAPPGHLPAADPALAQARARP